MRRINSRQRLLLPFVLVLSAVLLLPVGPAALSHAADTPGADDTGGVGPQIRARIKNAGSRPVECSAGTSCRSDVLPGFYEKRNFTPAWGSGQGPLDAVNAMVKAIRSSDLQGLRPEDYHLKEIEAVLDRVQKPGSSQSARIRTLADLDFLLTDAFLLLASDLATGRLDPEKVDPSWHIKPQKPDDLARVLDEGLASGDPGQALKTVAPTNPQYGRLIQGLAAYREIARKGGWPRIPAGKSLKPGDRDRRVIILRQRLMAGGDLEDHPGTAAESFDEDVENGIKRFQKRNGLDPDGRPGPKTLRALNVPVEERIRQIEVNLERWRWLPHDLGDRYILVNVPEFKLELYENRQDVLSMEIIVGNQVWSTPVFKSKMNLVELNPYWRIPKNIAVKEIIPRLLKNPGYLDKEGIKVLRHGRPIDPGAIHWSRTMRNSPPYLFRQEPGPKNSLGRIVFRLPNPYDIYLHDTPQRGLFQRTARGFSHGCIRVEKPIDLAAHLLRDDPDWTRQAIDAAVDTGETRDVHIPNPVMTYILYLTAWVDADGTVEFRPDIYKRDPAVEKALEEG